MTRRRRSCTGRAVAKGISAVRARPLALTVTLAMASTAFAIANGGVVSPLPARADPTFAHVCAPPASGTVACMAMVPADELTGTVQEDGLPDGFGPADLQNAYRLPVQAGSGQTVAIVDAFDEPNAEQDLARYRSFYNLPPCTTANGCFRKVNEHGAASPLPTADKDWGIELSLDLDMVSAGCPQCHILLAEANSISQADLYTAEDYATSQAKYVSNSWGRSEYSGETADDTHFNHPGVAIIVATGDFGAGPQYPAASRYVTAVGGTSLVRDGSSRGWSETAWPGAGSGCSAYESQSAWQGVSFNNCGTRAEADVSAIGDPNTGVAVADSDDNPDGWYVGGGTSAAAPLITAAYALAGPPGSGDTPASYPYTKGTSGNLFDVVSGSNGGCGAPLCTAGAGWDGPTGLGTPDGVAAFSSATPNVTATVPNVLSFGRTAAINAITASGLVASVRSDPACISPGDVLDQSPAAGDVLRQGSTVTITVDSGTQKTCGPIR